MDERDELGFDEPGTGWAGPLELARRTVVRPYVLTRGRTSSSLGVFALHAPVLALVTPEQLGRHGEHEEGPADHAKECSFRF